jgi:hypothetical protein
MKISSRKQKIGLAVAYVLTLGFASGAAQAQNFGPNNDRELWTTTPVAPAQQVWKNGFGECWHSAFGPPPPASECNPAPIAQYVAPPPPAPVAPAQAQYIAPPPPPAPVIVPAPLPPKKPRG